MGDARLHVTDRDGRRVVPLDKSPFTIGRAAENDLRLSGGEVSRTHAEIIRDGGRHLLRDLNSRYGTYVGDQAIQEHMLAEGDRIRLGRSPAVELVFLQDTEESADRASLVEAVRQTAALLEGLRALGAAHLLHDVLMLVLDAAIAISGADRGFVMLAGEDDALDLTVGRSRGGIELSGAGVAVSRKIPEDVFSTGNTRLVADLVDEGTAHGATLAIGIRQVLCVPLNATRLLDRPGVAPEPARIGVIYLDSREAGSVLLSDAARYGVETLATEAAVAIENARLYREALDKARVDQELRIAADMQKALRPPTRYRGAAFDLAAESRPCRTIGGDFYHYVALSGGVFGFALGDVAGKGPPAAVLAAAAQGMFAAYADAGVGPARTLARVNVTLAENFVADRFATLVYGMLWPDGRLAYSSAGHNPPILFSAQRRQRLTEGGVPLGLFPDAIYQEETLQLRRNDVLVFFSDGVSETTSPTGDVFGDEGIIDALSTAVDRDPSALIARLLDAVDAFRQVPVAEDDVTALVVSYRG